MTIFIGSQNYLGTIRWNHLRQDCTEKKICGFPVPSRDVTNQTLPGRGRENQNHYYSVTHSRTVPG